ncbi:MAG: carbohydrate binding domain-containing protein [Clostridia bacterium]|nr:carbohydrate binding domain-containing protein [Clostridia bacterium]
MKRLRVLSLLAVLFAAFFSPARADMLTVYPSRVLHQVSPTLYGIFLEDINCAVDGGLYTELIKNRSFENENLWNPRRADHWEAWSVRNWGNAKVTLENEDPLHENNPTFLRTELEENGFAMIRNQGFGGNVLRGGIPVEEGKRYDLSLWLRFDESASRVAGVSVFLSDAAGNELSPRAEYRGSAEKSGTWQRHEASLTALGSGGAYLTLEATGEGIVDVDMVSLMPEDRVGGDWPGGGMRKDLVEALKDLHPGFLRFPGGCVAEGTYVRSDAYNWKDSVSAPDAVSRREIPNTWGGMLTMGVGYYEYFCLCEEIGALPVPVVHAGLLCQARDVKDPPLTMEETEKYAGDILDLIEFALGGADTEWGGLRALMGHPEPFDLRYIAIGNENWGAAYFSRYEVLSGAVKEKYPEITCIVSAGPVAEGSLIRDSWNTIRRRFADDLVDEHYYMDSAWFPSHADRYDKYPRTTEVFLGEYAAHEPVQGSRRPGSLYAALCEAAFMTGIERNSDVVVMSCYAPLLCREGEVDWTPDLIWFNDTAVYKTPSYYVQQMFAASCGEELVVSETDGELFHSVTRTGNELQIKVVNLSDKAKPLTILLPGVCDQTADGVMLTGDKDHVNSFARTDKIAPQTFDCSCLDGEAQLDLPPWSLTILKFSLNE